MKEVFQPLLFFGVSFSLSNQQLVGHDSECADDFSVRVKDQGLDVDQALRQSLTAGMLVKKKELSLVGPE